MQIKILIRTIPFVLLPLSVQLAFGQKTVRYHLYVKDTLVNFAGKEKRAIAVNGQIPMPTLVFTEGDTAEVVVHNQLKESTSLHWHGVFLPNKEDGVPWLTQKPIEPGATHTYRFPIIQNGTHWYHSHSGLQEQIGMYGNFVMLKRKGDPSFRKGIDDLPTIPVVLSEWTNLNPDNVMRMLRYRNDWPAIQKGAVQSYTEAIGKGHFKTKLTNEWKRMLEMDVSDVYYDKVLMNGKEVTELKTIEGKTLKGGDKVRLRISNGGASSYFWLTYAGGKITVVANDGNDVEPVEVDRMTIGVSETYDVVVTLPDDNSSAEFLATTEDRINTASIFIGNGKKLPAERLAQLRYFEGMAMMNNMMDGNGRTKDLGLNLSLLKQNMNEVMYPEINPEKKKTKGKSTGMQEDHSAHGGQMKKETEEVDKMQDHSVHGAQKTEGTMKMSEMEDHSAHGGQMKEDTKKKKQKKKRGHSIHFFETDIVTLDYSMLKSPQKTNLSPSAPVKEITLTLTGSMNRYVWSMDYKILSEVDKIPVKKGEILRITLENHSMMRHPMHLHGYDFRVLNGQGDYAPLKNVLDILPMEKDTIEFEANEEGDWFFHCHILYHMMAGMNRVFAVGDYNNPLLPDKAKAYKKLQKESNRFHLMASNDFATNGNDGELMLKNTRWILSSEWRLGYNDKHGYETETHVGRYIGPYQWLTAFVGFDWRYRKLGHNEIETNIFGQRNTKDNRTQVSLGLAYTLPMLVILQGEVYQDGNARFQLMREDIPVSPRVRAMFMVNTDKEYSGGLDYIFTKNLRARAHYDSDMGFGVGLNINY